MSAADHYVFDVSFAIYQRADLTVNLVGDFGQLTREFLSDDFAGRNPPLI